jgi:hypothetical protein
MARRASRSRAISEPESESASARRPAPDSTQTGVEETGDADSSAGTVSPDVDEIEAATIQPAPRTAPRTSEPPRAEPGRSADQN